jgi:hypothetical protein
VKDDGRFLRWPAHRSPEQIDRSFDRDQQRGKPVKDARVEQTVDNRQPSSAAVLVPDLRADDDHVTRSKAPRGGCGDVLSAAGFHIDNLVKNVVVGGCVAVRR